MERVKVRIRKKDMEFPDLTELIKASGLSVEKFAAKMGVKRQTIYSWANHETNPSLDNMLMVCKFLGITERTFLNATGFDTQGLPSLTEENQPTTAIELLINHYSDEDKPDTQN